MSDMGSMSSLSNLMKASTEVLYECQQSLNKNAELGNTTISEIDSDQAGLLLKLMESLVDTRMQLTKEIESGRFAYIEPEIFIEMEKAIDVAIADPLDARINNIYLSIFGYNSPLWQVLRDMQKLLKTVDFLKDPRGRRVAKVNKKNRERRKKRHEKDSISTTEKEG